MDAVADPPKNLNRKITRLCSQQEVGPSQLSRIADVSPQAASAYLERSIPSAAALYKIAEHFDVSLHWLLDDEADEEHPLSDAEVLSDEYLMHEAARRYAAAENRLLSIIEAAESIDWEGVAKNVEVAASPDDATLKKLAVARSLYSLIQNTIELFDSVRVARRSGSDLRATFGDGDNDRREFFRKRIEAIFERLMPTPRAASAFMGFMQGFVFEAGNPDAAFELAEGCLAAAGVDIETPEARRVRLMNERNSGMQAHLDAGGPRARKRKS